MKKKLKSYLPSFVFVLFIGIMMLLFFVLPKKEYSSSEKRYLADFPTLSADTFFSGEFSQQFETYLSDHTAMRNFWVGLDSYYNLFLGNKLSNGVYHCKDGYLINDPCDTTRLDDNIDIICEFLKGREKESAVLIAPSTGYVTADVLPNKHIKYNDDMLFNKMSKTFLRNGIRFVDVRDTLKADYKDGNQVFYKTDHHWTSRGAYDAYARLANTLGFFARADVEYDIEKHDGFYGTTYSSSGYRLNESDTIELWSLPENDGMIKVNITDGDKTYENDGLFFYDHLKEDDKYPVFLDGSHPYTEITNNYKVMEGNYKKLLVIKDSFAHSLVPFLTSHYSKIVMVDLRYYKSSVSELIEKENFTDILFLYSIDNLAADTDLAWLE